MKVTPAVAIDLVRKGHLLHAPQEPDRLLCFISRGACVERTTVRVVDRTFWYAMIVLLEKQDRGESNLDFRLMHLMVNTPRFGIVEVLTTDSNARAKAMEATVEEIYIDLENRIRLSLKEP